MISRQGHNLGVGAGRFEAAIDLLSAGLETIEDPRWRSFVAADLAYAQMWLGRIDVDESDDRQSKPDAVRANECLAGAVIAVMSGELRSAEGFVNEGLPLSPAIDATALRSTASSASPTGPSWRCASTRSLSPPLAAAVPQPSRADGADASRVTNLAPSTTRRGHGPRVVG